MNFNLGLGALLTVYWIWRCKDTLKKAEKTINPEDCIYWAVSATGIFLFYILLFSYVWLVLGAQFVFGLYLLLNVRPINWNWLLSLVMFTMVGAITMTTGALLAHHDIDKTGGL